MEWPYKGFKAWPDSCNAAFCLTWDVDDETPVYARSRFRQHDVSEIEQRRYGIRRALPSVLRMLENERVPACFYVPAYIARQWPQVVRQLSERGYEVGAHGFFHEPVSVLTRDDENAIVAESLNVLETICQRPIAGYRTPAWQFNPWTADLLLDHGILYDSSLMGDVSVYTIKTASGRLVEVPIHWNLDDVEHWGHTQSTRDRSISAPSLVLDIWKAELAGIVQEGGVCVLTLHPHVSGRPGFLSVIQDFIRYAKTMPNLWWTTPGAIAEYAASRLSEVPTVRLMDTTPDWRYRKPRR